MKRLFFPVLFCLLLTAAGVSVWQWLPEPGLDPKIQTAITAREKYQSDYDKWEQSIIFKEEFSSDSLDTTKWATCYDWKLATDNGCTNGGNFEQQWYLPEQIKLANGELNLVAVKEPVVGLMGKKEKEFQYRSGMITTGRDNADAPVKWSRTYGYYEARLKFSDGQGVWPAFWLLPIDREWPPEIDIVEFLGGRQNSVLQTNHWPGPNGEQRKKEHKYISDSSFLDGWHTFATNWQPGRIDWYVDGKIVNTFEGSEVPDEEMEIILNLAIGGLLPGNANETTPFPATYSVDYVRVYPNAPPSKPTPQL